MTRFLFILLAGLVFEAVGVPLISKGLKEVGPWDKSGVKEMLSWAGRVGSQPHFLLGVLCEAIFFGILVYLLTHRDVSLIWPLTALGFVLTTLVAKFYLGEQVTYVRWTGVALIVAGVMLVTWSEVRKHNAVMEDSNPGEKAVSTVER